MNAVDKIWHGYRVNFIGLILLSSSHYTMKHTFIGKKILLNAIFHGTFIDNRMLWVEWSQESNKKHGKLWKMFHALLWKFEI